MGIGRSHREGHPITELSGLFEFMPAVWMSIGGRLGSFRYPSRSGPFVDELHTDDTPTEFSGVEPRAETWAASRVRNPTVRTGDYSTWSIRSRSDGRVSSVVPARARTAVHPFVSTRSGRVFRQERLSLLSRSRGTPPLRVPVHCEHVSTLNGLRHDSGTNE